jgi:DEAD/DEAH box helicase domain-containing protein
VHSNTDEVTQPLRERRAELDFYMRNPDNRPSIESIINELKDEEFYLDQIVPGGHRIFDARDASFGTSRVLNLPR